MKMIVVTTITTVLDVDSMTPEHSVEIEDKDGLSEISGDVLGAVLIGALHSTLEGVKERYPRAARTDT